MNDPHICMLTHVCLMYVYVNKYTLMYVYFCICILICVYIYISFSAFWGRKNQSWRVQSWRLSIEFHSMPSLAGLASSYFFFFFLRNWGLNSGLCSCKASTLLLESPPVHFAMVILEMRVLRTVCPGWPQTQSSWSQPPVARITGVSHQHPASLKFLNETISASHNSYLTIFPQELKVIKIVNAQQ
jgi:hypothetical protein